MKSLLFAISILSLAFIKSANAGCSPSTSPMRTESPFRPPASPQRLSHDVEEIIELFKNGSPDRGNRKLNEVLKSRLCSKNELEAIMSHCDQSLQQTVLQFIDEATILAGFAEHASIKDRDESFNRILTADFTHFSDIGLHDIYTRLDRLISEKTLSTQLALDCRDKLYAELWVRLTKSDLFK